MARADAPQIGVTATDQVVGNNSAEREPDRDRDREERRQRQRDRSRAHGASWWTRSLVDLLFEEVDAAPDIGETARRVAA